MLQERIACSSEGSPQWDSEGEAASDVCSSYASYYRSSCRKSMVRIQDSCAAREEGDSATSGSGRANIPSASS
jgi:hypothetical protein